MGTIRKLSENFLVRKLSSRNAKFGAKFSNFSKFRGKLIFLQFLSCRKFAVFALPNFIQPTTRLSF